MTWMNEYDIDDAARRWKNHPILGPATLTLSNLRDVTNRNSDGWVYWPKPARAASKLMGLIQGEHLSEVDRRNLNWENPERTDVTEAMLRKAYTPIKAFLTKQGLTCELAEPGHAAAAERAARERAEARRHHAVGAACSLVWLLADIADSDPDATRLLEGAVEAVHQCFGDLMADA